MAKLLVRGKGKFLEGKLIEEGASGVSLTERLTPTETIVEASSLLHFGTENMQFRIYNPSDWHYTYKEILEKANEAGADYVLVTEPQRKVFNSNARYETTLTMYLKKQ